MVVALVVGAFKGVVIVGLLKEEVVLIGPEAVVLVLVVVAVVRLEFTL